MDVLLAIPVDKRFHFVAGFIIAAFFGLSLGMKVVIVPAIFAGAFKELFDAMAVNEFEWKDLAATVCGGFLAQLFVILGAILF